MSIIIKKRLLSGRIKYIDFIKYEFDITSDLFIEKLTDLISKYEIPTYIENEIQRTVLPGTEFRMSEKFINLTYDLIINASQKRLLRNYNKLIDIYESRFYISYDNIDEIPNGKIKGWPKECPKCNFKGTSRQMGAHIRQKHPKIVKNYHLKVTANNHNNILKYKCSECLHSYSNMSGIKKHIRTSKTCSDISIIEI